MALGDAACKRFARMSIEDALHHAQMTRAPQSDKASASFSLFGGRYVLSANCSEYSLTPVSPAEPIRDDGFVETPVVTVPDVVAEAFVDVVGEHYGAVQRSRLRFDADGVVRERVYADVIRSS